MRGWGRKEKEREILTDRRKYIRSEGKKGREAKSNKKEGREGLKSERVKQGARGLRYS